MIWKAKEVLPKVKFFISKVIQGALPTADALAKRIRGNSPSCVLCVHDREDTVHILFHCAHARATWFQSSLGFRSDDFGDQTITEVLLNLWQPLDQEQMALSLASHIWKARCTQFFEVKQARPDKTLLAVEAWSRAIRLTKYRFPTIPTDTTTNPLQQADDRYYNCFLDGSFKDPDKGGATYIFYFNERLIRYEIIYKEEAASPFQMEEIALLQDRLQCKWVSGTACIFYTDSQFLANTFAAGKRLQQPTGSGSLLESLFTSCSNG